MDLATFRKKLDEATQCIPRNHVENIKRLKVVFPHSIEPQSNPAIYDNKDCFMYVFENVLPEDVLQALERYSSQRLNESRDCFSEFVARGVLSVHDECRPDDQVVVYYCDGKVRHFGTLKGDKVISKWGMGLVWQHNLFEVPLSYGNQVKYSTGRLSIELFKSMLSES